MDEESSEKSKDGGRTHSFFRHGLDLKGLGRVKGAPGSNPREEERRRKKRQGESKLAIVVI